MASLQGGGRRVCVCVCVCVEAAWFQWVVLC
jgi:hypothetical protein